VLLAFAAEAEGCLGCTLMHFALATRNAFLVRGSDGRLLAERQKPRPKNKKMSMHIPADFLG